MEGNTRAGFDMGPWCDAVGISKPTFYTLQLKPKVARIGRRVIIVESPAEYLQRLAAEQAKEAA